MEHYDPSAADGSVDRREFMGNAFLTTAGAVTAGLSAYHFTRQEPAAPDVSQWKKDPVRLGFIGVGRRGGALLRSAVKVPGNDVVAVCDVQESARNAASTDIKKQYQLDEKNADVQLYEDYRQLLADKNVEAVFIATPQYLHGSMALDAIESGKHVYCEKALALTVGENRDIWNMVNTRKSQVFQVGHQRHYSPLYRKVADMVREDVIGEVCAIRAQWNRNDLVRRACADPALEKIINWRLYSELSGGLTTEFASHQIDVANWVLGTHPDSVCGYGGVDWYDDGRDTEDNIHLIFNYRVPVVKRDAYGRPLLVNAAGRPVARDENGHPVEKDVIRVYEKDADGRTMRRNVRFTYTSVMQNEHLGPSELIMGRYGTLEVSLRGAEFFKESKARLDPNRQVEGTNPRRALQKKVLTTGSTVDPTTAGLPRRKGEPLSPETREEDRWVEFAGEIAGAYDTHETMLAIDGFMKSIRRVRKKSPDYNYTKDVSANVLIGVWGAVPALMANIAMREERIVYWKEFFPGEADEPLFLDDAGAVRTV